MNTRSSKVFGIIAGAAAVSLLSSCAAADPFSEGSGEGESGKSVVVGSANFPENIVLGEIYAQSLENAGYTVTRQLNIGAREVIYEQVKSCDISVVPEYNQALLAFLEPDMTAKGTEAVDTALRDVLPDSLKLLASSEAQDNNAVVVTSEAAEEFDLETIEDLNGVSADWVFGGPPEWVNRADGMAGLTEVYGTEYSEYRVLDYAGPITISALETGNINFALLFSTVPQIVENDYVVLEDPESVMGVNNIVPLACEEAIDGGAEEILEAISAGLSTEELTELNRQYSIEKLDAAQVAEGWLADNPLP